MAKSDKLDRFSKVPRNYRITIETLILMEKIAKTERFRSNAGFIETQVLAKAKELKLSVTDSEIEEFINRNKK